MVNVLNIMIEPDKIYDLEEGQKFNSLTIERKLKESDDRVSYLALHEDGSKKVLKLFHVGRSRTTKNLEDKLNIPRINTVLETNYETF